MKEQVKSFVKNISLQTTIALWICFAMTIFMGIWGFVCPPKGEIHESVLKFSTILFGFATLITAREAIKEGLGVKYRHNDTEIEIN